MNEPNIIIPTVGRVVHFRLVGPAWSPSFAINDDNVYAAHVAKVHSSRLVNLLVIDGNGTPWPQQSIPLRQPNDEAPLGNYCEWMGYQKGQAAKTEQLERQIAERAPTLHEPYKPEPERMKTHPAIAGTQRLDNEGNAIPPTIPQD